MVARFVSSTRLVRLFLVSKRMSPHIVGERAHHFLVIKAKPGTSETDPVPRSIKKGISDIDSHDEDYGEIETAPMFEEQEKPSSSQAERTNNIAPEPAPMIQASDAIEKASNPSIH